MRNILPYKFSSDHNYYAHTQLARLLTTIAVLFLLEERDGEDEGAKLTLLNDAAVVLTDHTNPKSVSQNHSVLIRVETCV